MFKNLPEIYEGKLISKNFGHISHLKGSKMIDDEDKMLSEQEQIKYTLQKRDKNDVVIITEKIDGMNAGVIKKNGLIYPINRKGYDTRQMGNQFEDLRLLGNEWARYVDERYEVFDKILNENEHLAFENAILQHTLKYKFKCQPVFLLAKYNNKNKKANYKITSNLAKEYGFEQPPLLNIGIALPPELILQQYPKGKLGVQGQIEGIVYNYEHNDEHESCAKFVSNPLMGTIDHVPQYYNNCIW